MRTLVEIDFNKQFPKTNSSDKQTQSLIPFIFLVPQFPYQKKALTFLGLVFFSRKTNPPKKVKIG